MRGLRPGVALAGSTPACRQTISSPHVHGLVILPHTKTVCRGPMLLKAICSESVDPKKSLRDAAAGESNRNGQKRQVELQFVSIVRIEKHQDHNCEERT